MNFFKEEPNPLVKSVDIERVESLAQRLYSFLKREHKLVRGTTIKSFHKILTRLFKQKGVEEVEQAFQWYMEHMDEEFVPQIYSASHLGVKFDKLVKAMDKVEGGLLEDIEPRNQNLADELLGSYDYPTEIAALLPLLVQRTRKNWTTFYATMISVWGSDKLSTRDHHFLDHIGGKENPVFVGNWMICMSHRLGKLDHYYGPVMKLAFTPTSEVFKKHFWQHWSSEWTGSPHTFDALLAELLKEKK